MGAAQVIHFTTTLESTECYKCGVTFAIPADMMNTARNKGRDLTFYCPNGHGQSFVESEVERLKRQLAAEKASAERARVDRDFWRVQKDIADRQVAAQRGINTKLKKRIGAGVCPCCQRTVSQLARHMKSKHPEFAKDAEAASETSV
jgi:hypothetical protein